MNHVHLCRLLPTFFIVISSVFSSDPQLYLVSLPPRGLSL